MAKAASPVRLQQELMEAATVAGQQLHRSTAEQIEYWADLGRRVAGILDPLELAEIATGVATLRVEPVVASPIDPDALFATLESRRTLGELSQSVTTAYSRYQASTTHPGYLELLDAEGHRTVGMFHRGIFTPAAENSN